MCLIFPSRLHKPHGLGGLLLSCQVSTTFFQIKKFYRIVKTSGKIKTRQKSLFSSVIASGIFRIDY